MPDDWDPEAETRKMLERIGEDHRFGTVGEVVDAPAADGADGASGDPRWPSVRAVGDSRSVVELAAEECGVQRGAAGRGRIVARAGPGGTSR